MTIKLQPPSKEFIDSERLVVNLAQRDDALDAAFRKTAADPVDANNDAERAEAVLRGETPPPRLNRAAMLDQLRSEIRDVQAARELHGDRHEALSKKEESRVKEAVQPAVDAEYRRLAEGLVKTFEALQSIEAVKRQLAARNMGWYSRPCPIDTDMFEDMTRTGDLAILLRELHQLGYLSKVPEGAR